MYGILKVIKREVVGHMRYYVNGKEITEEKAQEIDEMNALYFHLAEQGDFAALEKVQFIMKVSV